MSVYVQREQVVRTIKDFADAVRTRSQGSIAVFLRDQPDLTREALAEACRRNGISVEQHAAALRATPALAALEDEALTDAVVESPDPGPYDAISRESPSGQPGDLTKFRT